jgi:serine/threonine-protein kinase
MHKHLKEDLVPPDHLNPDLSAGVGEIIEVCMAKKRKMRYSSAEDLLTDLERVSRGEPPLVARQNYNLDSLAELEKGGTPSASNIQTAAGAVPVSAQNTIDIDPRPLNERLMDPIVISLGVALGLCIVLIIVLLLR